MENNLPVAPKDVETLRTELKRIENQGTLFVTPWALAGLALTTLEWADTLAQQVADSSAAILDLRAQLQEAQEIARDLVIKAEQWQKQLEWHYDEKPTQNRPVFVILVDKDDSSIFTEGLGKWWADPGDWYIVDFGWLNNLPKLKVECWQYVNYPLEFQSQDKESK